MCPCDATCKAVRLVEIFIDLSRRKSVILGEETAKQHLPRAELSGFVRLATLRKNKKDCQRVPSPLMSLCPIGDRPMCPMCSTFFAVVGRVCPVILRHGLAFLAVLHAQSIVRFLTYHCE